jgi:hypothetical protein
MLTGWRRDRGNAVDRRQFAYRAICARLVALKTLILELSVGVRKHREPARVAVDPVAANSLGRVDEFAFEER